MRVDGVVSGGTGLGVWGVVGDPVARGVELSRAVEGGAEVGGVGSRRDVYEGQLGRVEGPTFGEYLRRQNERDADVRYGGAVATGVGGPAERAAERGGSERVGFEPLREGERGGYGLPRLGDVPRAEMPRRVVEEVVRERREVMSGGGRLIDVVA